MPAAHLFGAGLAAAVAATRTTRGVPTDTVAGSLLLGMYADRVTGPVVAALQYEGRAARLAEAREFLAHEPRAARVVTLRTEECGGEERMFNERHACCLAFRSTLDQQLDEPYCGSCSIPDEAYRLDRFRRAATRYAERFPTIDEARPEQDPGPKH
jgi:hypothetical protein